MNNENQREPLSEKLDRFENEFKAGKTPKLEEYISCDSDILEIIEFIHIDLEQRFRKGQRPEVKDYISKYPELQNHPNEILELLKREIYLLSENGIKAGLDHYPSTVTIERFDLGKVVNPDLEYYINNYGFISKELKMYFRKQGYSLPEINGFSVLEKIGQGGMGEVYKARQISLSRDVAIKIVRYDKIKDLNNAEEYRRRFQKEGQTLASINHANVVKIYDAVKYEENLHLVMEYLEGESLQKKIQNEGNLSPQKAAEIVEKIARGLSEVHKKGVIHRDLKPDNIFLTLDGEPKVLDFGLARSIENADGRTQEWVFNGTPQYSSPEQSSKNGGEISFQTDVYGLGAILYSCLTGIAPFPKSGDILEILSMVRHQEVVPILALRPNCPKDLETICLKCLRKDPKQRYSSVLDFAEDLRRFQSGMPILARPVGSIEKLSKWVARNPVVSAAVSVAIITLISGTIISSLSAIYAKEQAIKAEEQAKLALSRAIEIEDKNKLLEISTNQLSEKNRSLEISEYKAKKNEELARASQIESQNEAKKAQKNLEIAVFQKKKADFQLYVNKIQRAENEINFGNSAVALNQLTSIPSPQRGWEHDYLFTLLTKNQATLKGHTSRVTSVCFSSNGKKILSGSDDTTLKLWDSSTGLELQSFNGHSGFITSVCLSPDGEMALSGSWDNTVKIWDCSTGKVLLTFKGHNEPVRSVCFSPDGKRVVSGDIDKTLKIWNAKTGKEILTLKGHKYGIFSANFSPDGMKIISGGGDNIVRVWNSYTGDEIQSIKGHEGIVFSVCFSPDGKKILSGSQDHTLRIWNSNTGDEIQSLKGHRGPVLGVCYSPDGSRIASSSFDNTVKVWDCATNQEMLTLKGHLLEVKSVCFSPDGKKIVTGSHDTTLKLWDSSKDQSIYSFKKHFGRILSVCFSPDGRKFLSSSLDKTIKLFDSANNQEILCLSGHAQAVSSICFSPDGKRIVSGSYDKTLKIWDSLTGNEVFTINGHQGSILSVCWSPDGRHIASAGADNTVKVWNSLNGREVFTLKGHTDVVSSVCFSPDNSRVLSGSWDKTVKVWDCSTGKEIFTLKGHTFRVSTVCFSPCGSKILSGSHDHDYALKLWDNYKGVLIRTFRGHTNFVSSCCFSPDGKRIISGSWDNTLKVWDSTEGLEIVSIKAGHTNGISSICYNPDGKVIVSGGLDNSINVWYGFNSKDRLEQDNAFLASLAQPDPRWHIQNAEDSEKNKQYFVAAFHLRKLIELEPNNETAKKRLEFIENKLKENK